MSQREQNFSLEHVFRRPDERSDGAPPLLLALHGIGSNERDLVGLQPFLDPRFFMVSARAPYEYAIPGGYSWFGLDIQPGGSVRVDIAQIEESRDKIIRFIDECVTAYGTDPKCTYLLGFSQGSIMSYSVLAKRPEKIAGIVAMSGRFLEEFFPAASDERIAGFPILVIHGLSDEVLPIQNGRMAQEKLTALKTNVEYHEYPMGHEVSRESIADVKKWLTGRLDGR